MGRSQGVFLGEVDRISSSENAIVNQEDIIPLHRIEKQPYQNRSINLGPLPPETVGEEVLFTYEGGTFGCCVDTRYIDRNYLRDMSGRAESGLAKLSVGILEIIDPGDVLFIEELSQLPDNLLTDAQYLASVKIPPVPNEDSSEMSQTSVGALTVPMQDSTIQNTLPAPVPVEVTEINSTYIETARASDEVQYNLPDTGETITVTTGLQTELGTLATYEADCLLRVVIEDAQYPSGETIQLKVIDVKSTHIVGEAVFSAGDFDVIHIRSDEIPEEQRQSQNRLIKRGVPIDIEPVPADATTTTGVVVTDEGPDALVGRWNIREELGPVDITRGDEIEVEIQSICEDTCTGHHNQFPVQIKFDRAVPTELKHQSIPVLIQTVHADRAIAKPIWITGAHGELDVQVIGKKSGDAIAINEGHLIIIPESSVVSPSNQLRVSPSESSDNDVPTATVSARPIFQDAETTCLIRLPNTRGDVVYVNETPVVVDHLPDVDSTVTLGISEVNKDHVVPTVDALPEAHIPSKGNHILVEIQKPAYQTSDGVTVGTTEELPLKILPPFVDPVDDTVTAKACGCSQSTILSVSDDHMLSVYKYLQSADSALRQSDYQGAIQHLTEAIQSCPSPSLLERLLVIYKTMAQAVVSIQSNSSLIDTADTISTGLKRLREFNEDNETATNITAFLSAREAEMKAIELLVTILSDLTDVDTDMQEIKTLRCRPMIFEAIEHLRTAERRGAKTQFEQQTPSFAVWLVTQEFQDRFPLDVYEARHSQSLRDSSEIRSVTQEINDVFSTHSERVQQSEPSTKYADWLHCLLQHGVSEHDDVTLTRADADSNISHRPATPEEMGITPMTEIGDDKNAHIESAQKSDSETSTTEQTSTSKDDLEGGTETESETSSGPTDSIEKPSTPNLSQLQTLRRRAEKESSENPEREDVSSSTTTTSRYKRSSAVRKYALVRADGKCELCEEDAPFIKESGDPYLEVHHVNELSEGGADDPSIVGAVCPSCHKEIHYGKDGDELNEKLRERLQDGLGNVGVVNK